jgi:hydrogenase assembly chaperone HypC/HupF
LERITGTGLERRGMVSVGGVERDVSIALVPHVEVGDWVIFHSGYALRRVDESEARAVYEILGDGPADVVTRPGPDDATGFRLSRLRRTRGGSVSKVSAMF